MLPLPAGREASAGVVASVYERHRPERTLLYQLVEERYPAFKAELAAQGTALPRFVEREFDEYLALVPKPRVNLTRFHGVFAPNSAHRARVTPAKRGKGNKARASHAPEDTRSAERRAAMSLERSASSACSISTSRLARPAAGTSRSSPASKLLS